MKWLAAALVLAAWSACLVAVAGVPRRLAVVVWLVTWVCAVVGVFGAIFGAVWIVRG